MVEYYDAVLGLIPASFLGLGGFLSGVGLPLTTAVPVAALVAVALVCHAMFVRTPGGTLPDSEG
jgi:hypothetical protein